MPGRGRRLIGRPADLLRRTSRRSGCGGARIGAPGRPAPAGVGLRVPPTPSASRSGDRPRPERGRRGPGAAPCSRRCRCIRPSSGSIGCSRRSCSRSTMVRVKNRSTDRAVVRSSRESGCSCGDRARCSGVSEHRMRSTSVRPGLQEETLSESDRPDRPSTGRLDVCADNGIELLNRVPFMGASQWLDGFVESI